VTEARSASGEQFELLRLEGVLRGARGDSAAVLVDRVTKAVATFVAGAPPEDDVTVLALRFTGPKQT
jgi:serine phosphatase RsbU (regulator of sigma subunit)